MGDGKPDEEGCNSDISDSAPTRGKEFDRERLRRTAVEHLRSRHRKSWVKPADDLATLVNELEIHQAELEVQNEELRRIQADLLAMRNRYRDLYEFAPVGYLSLDAKCLIRQVNLAAAKLCGRERENMIGRRVESLMVREDRDSCFILLTAAATAENVQSRQLRLCGPDGRICWVDVEVSSVPSNPDQAAGFRMTLSDISARKRAEEALTQLNEQLEAKIAERTDDLERAVETLRTEIEHRIAAEKALKEANEQLTRRAEQLRALAGELTLTENRERRHMAKVLHDHLQQMLVAGKFRAASLGRTAIPSVRTAAREIEQLLDQCVSTSRSLTAELSPPILYEAGLLPGLEWLARRMTEQHGLKVNLTLEKGIPLLAPDVNILLFESVREILFNTVKHARGADANVDVCRIGDDWLRITIADGGPGFDPAAIRTAGESGGGFGLFAIRERLGMYGGRMDIHSAPGKGSRFVLSLPMAATETVPEAQAGPETRRGVARTAGLVTPQHRILIRILLADDHAIVRQGLAHLLSEEPDLQIIGEAADGREAVELADELLPDLILMDLSMPKLSGIEATRTINTAHPEIRIVGLSMFEEDEQAEAMINAGAAAYLPKSGPSTNLIAAIRDCMSRPVS